ncbi:Actin/actin-like protein [Aspergillus heteromorphus CBS 117.55]|uniref:Actin/actin-like protein n=1 Tax=Aspergillus heteromorphus CBS 117.55 TaxID=1448321 RepID=A0A317UT17_9EURO|nr:Actin/actin-like protein [Aspergillus heteromorphus CBS 117.55]PWY64755.1 Actin/actin-like protein [Aspergillus heteromorphus CBS 117.55]
MAPAKPRPAGRASVAKVQSLPDKTFIIDNGAYTMKAGYAPNHLAPDDQADELSACSDISNAIVKTRGNRTFVGSQLNTHVTDWNEMSFRRPVEKGYIVNWEAQKEIWEHSFFDEKTVRSKDLRIHDPEETTLLLTEAPNALPMLQKNADEIIMEEWGFGGYLRCVGPPLNAWNDVQSLFGDPIVQEADPIATPRECLLVVDSGYSHTIVTPVYKGQPLQRAIRRLDLGGKHLTNYLKEIVSIRQYNMVDETYIMNEVKEAVCFVSTNFAGDMGQTWKGNRKRGLPDLSEGVMVDYVLPDPNAGKKGFMRPHDPLFNAKKRKGGLSGASAEALSEDALVLGNERFAVPEILFTPSDIGMKQAGIPDIIMQCLSVLPTGLHPAFLANVLVVGGNSLLPGFVERLETELRQLASAECAVRVRCPQDPIRSTWSGASRFATNKAEMRKVAITRQEYQEHGSSWAARKFAGAL